MINHDDKSEFPALNKFFQSKGFFSKALCIAVFSIILFWGLMNLSPIAAIFGKLFSLVKPILYGFCIAYIINIFMSPIEKLWDKVFKKRKISFTVKRTICLILSIILVVGIVFAVFFLIIPELTQTIYSLINILPEYMASVETFVKENLKAVSIPHFNIDTNEIISRIGAILPKISSDVVNTTVDLTSSIISAIITFAISIVFSFYMLAQKEKLCHKLKRLLFAAFSKHTANKVLAYLDLTNSIFTNFFTGQFTEAVIIGTLCFVGMLILRIPYALIISVLVGFTALIPVFGAFIGTAIGAFLIVMVNPLKALWFVVFVIILQQLEGNLIYPKVVGKSVGLPGILVLTAVTIGSSSFGIAGILLGVPIVSVIYSIMNQITEKRLKEKKIRI